MLFLDKFENGQITGFRAMKIHNRFNQTDIVRIVHDVNHFIPLLRRRRSDENIHFPQSYVSGRVFPDFMYELNKEDLPFQI